MRYERRNAKRISQMKEKNKLLPSHFGNETL